jgi:hypothetical protein
MKKQYLGDSKDSFKWDYHDFLAEELNYPVLNIMLMMTPDDESNDGKTHSTLFLARKEILDFCNDLRNERKVVLINSLPRRTNSNYTVNLHNNDSQITNQNRKTYFSGLSHKEDQLLFLDPDNGFEPEKSFNEKHVLYSDLSYILEQISESSVVSVFQHFRREAFTKTFARIKERLKNSYATAIYWNFLMFVAISKSEGTIKRVSDANKKYSKKTIQLRLLPNNNFNSEAHSAALHCGR